MKIQELLKTSQKTLTRLQQKAADSSVRMPTINAIHMLLDNVGIEHSFRSSKNIIEKRSAGQRYSHSRTEGKSGYKIEINMSQFNGLDIEGETIVMDSSDSFYSWSTWIYAGQLVKMVENKLHEMRQETQELDADIEIHRLEDEVAELKEKLRVKTELAEFKGETIERLKEENEKLQEKLEETEKARQSEHSENIDLHVKKNAQIVQLKNNVKMLRGAGEELHDFSSKNYPNSGWGDYDGDKHDRVLKQFYTALERTQQKQEA